MWQKKQKSFYKRFRLFLLVFFRTYPAAPYIFKWMMISISIGVCIGSASAGFLISLDRATDFREHHRWVIAGLPIAGFLIGLLYHRFGKEAESGNNLLIDTIHRPQARIPFRMAPLVYIGTIATHFFGGSAGREGTALQMAGAIADPFTRPFRLSPADRSILIIAAIAGGFASVFGTPLAGAIFGLEFFLIGNIRYRALFPAFLTAVIADSITRLWGAHHTSYTVAVVPDASFTTVLYTLLAGIFFGVCAALFSKVIHRTTAFFKTRISYPPLRPFIGGCIVVLAVWAMGTTKYIGLGIPTIISAFDQQLPYYDFALKMAFTIITLATGFKGGEVTPLFFIGATLGSTLSCIIPLPVGLLAGMGFVAVFAGATNTPVACSIMAMELFGTECGIFAAMACVVSYLLSGNNSIYSQQMIGEPKNTRFSGYEGKRIGELKKRKR